jgi:hypothetical protein
VTYRITRVSQRLYLSTTHRLVMHTRQSLESSMLVWSIYDIGKTAPLVSVVNLNYKSLHLVSKLIKKSIWVA